MKKKNKVVTIIMSVIVVVTICVLLFFYNFDFFRSPKTHVFLDGTEIEYYETKSGNNYMVEDNKLIRIAIPVI